MTKLHQFLFGENDYTPSSTVQSISEDISNSTYDTGESYDTEYDEYGYSQDYSGYDSGYTDNSYGNWRISGQWLWRMAALVMGIQKIPAVIMYLRQMAAVQTVEAATVIPRYRIPEPATVVIPVERA